MNLYEAKYTANQQAFECPFEIPPLEDFPFEETVPRGPPVEEPVPSPTPDPVPGPEDAPPPAPSDTPSQDAPTGGGKPKSPSNNQPKDPNTDRDPKAEPDPKEKPKPDPPPPGARFSRCRKQVICFDTGGKDLEKYMEQLKTQQNAINRKSACKNAADIEDFDQKSDQEKKDYRASGDEQKEEIQNLYEQAHPNYDRNQYNALHELDMVAGGDPKTFSGVGDAGINKSIGARWNQKNRKNDLWNYAKEMCAAKCKMAVVLAVCSYVKPPAGGLVA